MPRYIERVVALEELQKINRQPHAVDNPTPHQREHEAEMHQMAAQTCNETPMERWLTLDFNEDPNYVYRSQITAGNQELRCIKEDPLGFLHVRKQATGILRESLSTLEDQSGTTEGGPRYGSDAFWSTTNDMIAKTNTETYEEQAAGDLK